MKLCIGWIFGGLIVFLVFVIVYMFVIYVVGWFDLLKGVLINKVLGMIWFGKV